MNLKLIFLFIVSTLVLSTFAGTFSVSPKEHQQMLDEAENWIDDMPDGLQDRLSDAVNHAMSGFFNEVQYFRSLADTTGIRKFRVNIKDIQGGKGENIPMRIYKATKTVSKQLPLLIYFHGGGWSVGSIGATDKFCRALASAGNVMVVSVEYPLAPEHPYPAGIETCKEAVDYICKHVQEWGGSSSLISLGGDGAGGNLALNLYQQLPTSINIKSLVLYYPLIYSNGSLDLKNKKEFGRGYGFDSRVWEAFINAYNDKSKPTFDRMPPVLLITAGRDIIINEEKEFSSLSNKITYIQFDGAIHGFITDGHQPTAFTKAVDLTDRFLTTD